MRAALVVASVVGAGAIAACVHEERPLVPTLQGTVAPPRVPHGSGRAASAYVLADPVLRPVAGAPHAVEHEGVLCAVVDGLRVRVDGPVLHAAEAVADPSLVAVHGIPPWLGGGFLFRSAHVLYRSARCEGALEPIVSLPGSIEDVAFGPRFALVRGDDGQRWGLDLATAAPAPLAPPGVVDIVADAQGRALALNERGAVLLSVDGGATYADVSASMGGAVEGLLSKRGELWVAETRGTAHKLEGSALVPFDKPPAVTPPAVRPPDERWRAPDAPLRRALRLGVPDADGSLLVLTEGLLVRLEATTGRVLGDAPAPVPPDAVCEGVRTADGPLFACHLGNVGGYILVALEPGSLVATVDATVPLGEQAYAADDGSLAFAGPCGTTPTTGLVACVRGSHGTWREVDATALVTDGGAPPASVRWVPRADGGAVLLYTDKEPVWLDVRTGEAHPVTLENAPSGARALFGEARTSSPSRATGRVLDHTLTTVPSGALRAWLDDGTSVEISVDGVIRVSPYSFPRLAPAGAFALARTRDGRTWQTADHGASWAEVAPPPSSRSGGYVEVRGCSAAGCDLGSWYRLGWPTAAPGPEPSPASAPSARRLAPAPKPVLACEATGALRTASLPRGDRGSEDLSLGLGRAPAIAKVADVEREAHLRVLVHPVREGDGGRGDDDPAARALLWARPPQSLDEGVSPGRLHDLRAELAYVAPFDAAGVVRRAVLSPAEIVGVARRAGLARDEAFGGAGFSGGSLVPVLTPDAAGASEVAFATLSPWIAVLRPFGPPRFVVRLARGDDARVIGAARLEDGTLALLEATEGGAERVVAATGASPTVLFEVPPSTGTLPYPENPDALAVGPRGELGVVRTRTGAEPPTAADPALLFTASGAVVPLAPWATLALADEPVCQREAGGYRMNLAAKGAWLKLASAGVSLDDEAPFFARVRWTPSRVCLEAVELRTSEVATVLRQPAGRGEAVSTTTQGVETWLVARFTGASPSASRLGIAPGIDVREPWRCRLAHGPAASTP